MVRGRRSHLRDELPKRLTLGFAGISRSELGRLQLERAARLGHVRHIHLGRVQRVVEHLREHVRIDGSQARPATAFDLQDAHGRKRSVGFAHAPAAHLEVATDLDFAGHQVTRPQVITIDERKQVSRHARRQGRPLERGQGS